MAFHRQEICMNKTVCMVCSKHDERNYMLLSRLWSCSLHWWVFWGLPHKEVLVRHCKEHVYYVQSVGKYHSKLDSYRGKNMKLFQIKLETVYSKVTPWRGGFLENVRSPQVVTKPVAFYETQGLIAVFISTWHQSLSWARSIQSMPSHPTTWRSILILSSHLCWGLPAGLVPSGLPSKTLHACLLSPISATCPAYLIGNLLE